jgi:hypothetical protein
VPIDNPKIEAFYGDVESLGLGDLKANQALRDAKEVCEHGDALILWPEHSLVESFSFADAAIDVCDEL